jgi:hypothetical protein
MSGRPPRSHARALLLVTAVSALAFLLGSGPAAGAGRVVLEGESFVCTGPVDLDLVKVTMRTYTGGVGGPGVDAIVLDPGCTGSIRRIEVDTWLGDGVKIRVGPGSAHDLTIGSGYVRCHAIHGSIHQDGVQAGDGQRITFRDLAIDCLGNSNFYTTGWGGGHADGVVCDGCALGPGSASTLFTNRRSVSSGARDSLVCEGRHPQLTFRLASPTSVNVGNQRAAGSDARCGFAGLLAYVDYTPAAEEAPAPAAPAAPAGVAAVDAALGRVTFGRTATGTRAVRVRVELGERSTVTLRVGRDGRMLARRRTTLASGAHTLRLLLSRGVAPGPAVLRVIVADGAGNRRAFTRTLRLPAVRPPA